MPDTRRIIADLLAHYDSHRRRLPWRADPGVRPDPYHVWLSEIMLQQTTVQTVIPYFEHFLTRWPTVADLAAAEQDAVMHAWQGLGYYSRARNLLKCARVVVGEHAGRFPETEAGLRTLPGVGPYTAAAIAAIAFDQPTMPVDGNIERVSARLFAVTEAMPTAKPQLKRLAATMIATHRPGDMAQALMDHGATICTPRSPACGRCPIADECLAHAGGIAADLPRKAPKKAKPTRHAVFFWLTRAEDGAVLFQRRPDRGLLGGMVMPPSTDWRDEQAWETAETERQAPVATDWKPLNGAVSHTFTHFHFQMQVWVGHLRSGRGFDSADDIWSPPDQLDRLALPTVAKKVCRHALSGGTLV
ncbi:MAG: A/G-specific adenine glycosylase [Minwuia sp.]|nr:A/G-specific adenine glycosylase [Minwuia sp.]